MLRLHTAPESFVPCRCQFGSWHSTISVGLMLLSYCVLMLIEYSGNLVLLWGSVE
jgi:hypothetical protein